MAYTLDWDSPAHLYLIQRALDLYGFPEQRFFTSYPNQQRAPHSPQAPSTHQCPFPPPTRGQRTKGTRDRYRPGPGTTSIRSSTRTRTRARTTATPQESPATTPRDQGPLMGHPTMGPRPGILPPEQAPDLGPGSTQNRKPPRGAPIGTAFRNPCPEPPLGRSGLFLRFAPLSSETLCEV